MYAAEAVGCQKGQRHFEDGVVQTRGWTLVKSGLALTVRDPFHSKSSEMMSFQLAPTLFFKIITIMRFIKKLCITIIYNYNLTITQNYI